MTIHEKLFVGTSSDEHVEMYLKAMWLIKENNEPIKVSMLLPIYLESDSQVWCR